MQSQADHLERPVRTLALVCAAEAYAVFGTRLVVRHAGGLEGLPKLFEGVFADIAGCSPQDTALSAKFAQWRARVFAQLEKNVPVRTERRAYDALLAAFEAQGSVMSSKFLLSNPSESYMCHVVAVCDPSENDSNKTDKDKNEFVSLCLDNEDPAEGVFCASTNMDGRWKEAVVEPLGSGFVLSLTPIHKNGNGGNGNGNGNGNGHSALSLVMRSFERARKRGAITETESTGALNLKIMGGQTAELSRREELRFQCDLLEGIEEMRRIKKDFKLILIAGPSASCKTTFAHRLSEALRAQEGCSVAVLSGDDYYRDTRDKDYPLLPNGKPNHETVEALRIDYFQEQVMRIFNGEAVNTPIFDMVNSRPKEGAGRVVQLDKTNGVLIVEGLFCLSPVLTAALPQDMLVRVFICPLPQFAATELSVVPNQTVRTMRRITRDWLFRGRGAAATINRLAQVVAGEESTVMPTIAHADYVFNSAMDSELNVISSFSVPLLAHVPPSDTAAFPTASRLMKFMRTMLPASEGPVPDFSLLREFIGGSCFSEEDLQKESEYEQRRAKLIAMMLAAQEQQQEEEGQPEQLGGGAAAPAAATAAAAEKEKEDKKKKAAVATQQQQHATATVSPAPITYGDLYEKQEQQQKQKQEQEKNKDGSLSLSALVMTSIDDIHLLGGRESDTSRPIAVVVNDELRGMREPIDFAHRASMRCEADDDDDGDGGVAAFGIDPRDVLRPVYRRGTLGVQIATSTSAFVLCAAVFRWRPTAAAVMLHGLGFGRRATRWVVQIRNGNGNGDLELSKDGIEKINATYAAIVAKKEKIAIATVSVSAAVKKLAACGQRMSAALLESSTQTHVNLAILGDFVALAIEPVGESTEICSDLTIEKWVPSASASASVPVANSKNLLLASASGWEEPLSKGAMLFDETVRTQRALLASAANISCVGDLNRLVIDEQESKAKRICDYLSLSAWMDIVNRVKSSTTPRIRQLIIEGPKRSGKTEFANTLAVAFASCGVKCHVAGEPVARGNDIGPNQVVIVDQGAPASSSNVGDDMVNAFNKNDDGAGSESEEADDPKDNPYTLQLFVAPLATFNVTEQLPVSASDIRRIRNVDSEIIDAQIVQSACKSASAASYTSGFAASASTVVSATASPSPSRPGKKSQHHQQDLQRSMSGVLRREYSIIERGTTDKPFLEADVVVSTSDVFEITRAKHRATQRLALLSKSEPSLAKRVANARVARVLNFFLGSSGKS